VNGSVYHRPGKTIEIKGAWYLGIAEMTSSGGAAVVRPAQLVFYLRYRKQKKVVLQSIVL